MATVSKDFIVKNGIIVSNTITSTDITTTSAGGGSLYLNGTSNRIDFNNSGVSAPTFTTISTGTKIVLYPNVGASAVDFALGIESGTMWSSVPTSANQFKWYAGTTSVASLSGAGTFSTTNISYTGTLTGSTGILNIGSGQVYKDASGNVGIGTSSPASKLHVANGVDTQIRVSTPTNNFYFDMGRSTADGLFQINGNQGSGYKWLNNGAEKMRIDSSGNVGIGTSSPYNATTDVLTVARNQNAITQLLIDNQNVGASSQTRLALEASGGGWYIANQKTGNPLTFSDNVAERMRIDASGNVGIGTSSPSPTNASTIVSKLVIAGAGIAQGIQSVRTGGGGAGGAQLILSSTKGADANTYTPLVSSEGIGTLSFNGADGTRFIPAAMVMAQVDGVVSTDNVLGRLVFGTSAGGANSVLERMRIDSSGNVGIGTTATSTDKLTVSAGTSQGLTVDANGPTITFSNAGTALCKILSGSTGASGLSINSSREVTFNTGSLTAPTGFAQLGPSGGLNIGYSALNMYSIPTNGAVILGNVGIGTSSPAGQLGVNGIVFIGNQATTGSTGTIRMTTSAGVNYIQSGLNTTAASAAPLVFGSINAGNEWMRIDSSGNVGIGTSSPSVKLHVATGGMAVQGGAAFPSSGAGWEIVANTGAGGNSIQSYSRTTSSWMDAWYFALSHRFCISGAERMRIDSSGNVGIGTSSPSSYGKLAVFGDIVSVNNAGGWLAKGIRTDSSISRGLYDVDGFGAIALYTASVEAMRIDTSGNVGIGTSIPTQKLHVAGGIFADGGPVLLGAAGGEGGEIAFQSISGTSAGMIDVDGGNNWRFYNALATSTIFVTNSAERMRITSSGKVGIGTTAPNNPLHVVSGALNTAGDSVTSQVLQITGADVTSDTSNGIVVIAANNTLGADIGGSLGFGARYTSTSQFTCAQISGRKLNATDGDFAGYMAFSTRANGLQLSEKARLTSAGCLSIGTTAVGAAGQILATGSITAMYSDKRLKENIKPITNALDKVDTLTGMLFTQNELAESFGYTDKDQQVGVFAQEVQKVLPEAVKLAPFDMDGDGNSKSGENYLTVQYEKLVPLLIEAIKELRLEVKALKGI